MASARNLLAYRSCINRMFLAAAISLNIIILHHIAHRERRVNVAREAGYIIGVNEAKYVALRVSVVGGMGEYILA